MSKGSDGRPVRVYVHGSGRTGADAWPQAPLTDAVFVELDPEASPSRQATAIADAAPANTPTVIAHSSGTVPVVLAVADGSLRIHRLVLVEPALYDIARGVPAIERHIAAMTAARTRAQGGDLPGYWAIVRPLMFGGPSEAARWEDEEPLARRFSRLTPPWGHGISAPMIEGIATLVVTGGWNGEYEAIAAVLARHGAEHRTLAGHGHRPQDDPGFAQLVEDFVASSP